MTGWHARSPAGHFRFQTKPVRHDSLPRELESEGTQSHHSPDTFPLRRPKATLSYSVIISLERIKFLVKGRDGYYFAEHGLRGAARVRLEGIPFVRRARAEEG